MPMDKVQVKRDRVELRAEIALLDGAEKALAQARLAIRQLSLAAAAAGEIELQHAADTALAALPESID